MKEYYINQNGKQEGPLSLEEVQKIKINRTALIWHEGLNEWVTATEIPEINEILRKEPPPLPTMPPPIPELIPAIITAPTTRKKSSSWWKIGILLLLLGMLFFPRFNSIQSSFAPSFDFNGAAKAEARQNIRQTVKAQVAGFRKKFLGGIADCEIRLSNYCGYHLDEVEVRVDYIRVNGTIWQSEKIYFRNITPDAILGLPAPDSDLGVRVECEVINIRSSELGI